MFLIAIYFGVLIGLKYLDIFGIRFYSSGLPVIVYILLKTIFTFLFSDDIVDRWSRIAAGSFCLNRILLPLEQALILSHVFFLGASTLALLMFILGFLKAYYFATAIIITAPLVGLAPLCCLL